MRRRLCRKCVKPHKCNGSSFKNSIKENLKKSREIPKCKKMLTCFLIILYYSYSLLFFIIHIKEVTFSTGLKQ